MPLWWRQPFSDPAEREAMIDSAVERLKPELYRDGRWYADYMRLRMKAVRR